MSNPHADTRWQPSRSIRSGRQRLRHPAGHHQPAHRRAAGPRVEQVRAGDLRGQARTADQRLLQPARRRDPRVRGPAGRARPAGEAAVDRDARDPRRPARAHRGRVGRPPAAHGAQADRRRRRRRHRRLQGVLRWSASSPRPGTQVRVIPTDSALRFVGAATFEALSGNPVHTGVFDDVHEVPHVRIGQDADLVVVAPATADLLARAAHGRADDLLTATLLTARCPVLFAPGDAHRDVVAPGDRRERRHPAPPRCRRARTGVGPAHRRRHRRGPAARARGDHHARPAAARPRRRAAARPGRASRCW